jgi:hypothetical protein
MRCDQYSCFKQRAFTGDVIEASCITTYSCKGFTIEKKFTNAKDGTELRGGAV